MQLTDRLEEHFRLTPQQKSALTNLGIATVRDLLYHFPQRYTDTASVKNIADVTAGERVSVYGQISNLDLKKGWKSKMAMATGTLTDATGSISVVWFNQPYIAKMLHNNSEALFTGTVSKGKGDRGLYLSNPEYEHTDRPVNVFGDSLFGSNDEHSPLYPIYSESRGITSRWIFHAIQKIIKTGVVDALEDPIPSDVLEKFHLPRLNTSMVWVHLPRKHSDAEAARKRFAFEEIFFIQLARLQARAKHAQEHAWVITKERDELEPFTKRFSFPLTAAQEKSIEDILADFKKGHPMARLLEGDVGSGKTAVAATTAYAVVTTRPPNQTFGTLQVAYMAPTEILATQHFQSFCGFFKTGAVQIGLITGSGCYKYPSKVSGGATQISRAQLLKWVANGEIPILIGTHALIQKTVKFKHLGYVIIDEQHRFGLRQRQQLVQKDGKVPHLLSMTATPIPRTLALTIYGDLDLSLLDEMPPGRKRVITEVVQPHKRNDAYERIRTELEAGRQLYVICPRIDEPDPSKELALAAKSVKAEAKRLKKDIFPEYEIDILHSKMTPKKKDEAMEKFASGETDILVATSVVEVGVNVPNATVIIIEGAERFGLAQLHQLRGRVVRSTHQSYCYVFAETASQKTQDRLRALTTAANGFELAEHDLQLRGAGELSGGKQWGVSDVAMDGLKNLKLVEAARTEAQKIIQTDQSLDRYPLLQEHIHQRATVHFE
jgi:ATP-dependent DNA helicase RecG